MHLKRVRVPDFRVLKDVDITFEKEFTPKIFPLGSQNGGGKSTLLQLIFVLLHCSPDPEKLHFIKNMIDGFKLRDGENKRILATFDIIACKEEAVFEFFVCNDFYFKELFEPEELDELNNNQDFHFPRLEFLEGDQYEIFQEERSISSLEELVNEFVKTNTDNENLTSLKINALKKSIETLGSIGSGIIKFLENKNLTIKEKLHSLKIEIQKLKDDIEISKKQNNVFSNIRENILNKLKSNNIFCLIEEKELLLCQIRNLDLENAKHLLNELSNKVFLAAPSTQVFLFLDRQTKMLLFHKHKDDKYYFELMMTKLVIIGLFMYDFFLVDLLIDSFMAARDKDFQIAITTGKYGNHYQTLLNQLNSLLANKKLSLKADLSGVNFSMDNGNEIVELGPEDLSHGELKRLSIYMWLKYRNIEDAIVLMDEIEIAFHPDWQYRIIADLQDWGPNNQYILATHSYSLCEALTPAHVKEIEPKLLPVKANN
jgi:predicted ATPase